MQVILTAPSSSRPYVDLDSEQRRLRRSGLMGESRRLGFKVVNNRFEDLKTAREVCQIPIVKPNTGSKKRIQHRTSEGGGGGP